MGPHAHVLRISTTDAAALYVYRSLRMTVLHLCSTQLATSGCTPFLTREVSQGMLSKSCRPFR